MTTSSKKQGTPIIIWSIVWALAIIATAFFFKSNPSQIWMEAILNVVGITVFLVLNSQRTSCVR